MHLRINELAVLQHKRGVNQMEFLRMVVSDLASDGYSKWFAVGFVLSCLPLIVDIIKNGWNLEDGE